MQGVSSSDLFDLLSCGVDLGGGESSFEDHHIVEVDLFFAVDFDESEVAVLEGLEEVVPAVEAFEG